MIFYGLTQQKYIYRLHLTVEDEATIYNWFVEFYCGRKNLSNKFREGRPRTDVFQAIVDVVRQMIEMDRYLYYREIATLDITMKQKHSMLREHWAVGKVCCRWISYDLTEAERRFVWIGARKF